MIATNNKPLDDVSVVTNATTSMNGESFSSSPDSSVSSGSIDTNHKSWMDSEIIEPHVGYKKVLVTGGAGFIGSHVAEDLLARGDDVVIIDEINDYYDVRIKESNLKQLQESYPEKGRVTIYRGDICDRELMEKIFKNENNFYLVGCPTDFSIFLVLVRRRYSVVYIHLYSTFTSLLDKSAALD